MFKFSFFHIVMFHVFVMIGGSGHTGTAGTNPNSAGGNGGSGIVIIRYKFQ